MNPLSFVRSEVLVGIVVELGNAPTSDAESVTLDDNALPFTVLDVGTAPTSAAV